MNKTLRPDLCVIGAGSGGLSVAAAAAQLGTSVALIERNKMGGDCLNTGCVPSKAMLAAGKRAQNMRTSDIFGITSVTPQVDWAKVNDHVKQVIAAIEPNDSVERFTGLGVQVIKGEAAFASKREVVVGDTTIRARRFVIATGSKAATPPVPGLMNVPFMTNETLFENRSPISHLIIIGGGPIGMEMAQAHHRLGAQVSVLEAFTPLAKDDPELTEIVLKTLKQEGIAIYGNTRIEKLEQTQDGIEAHIVKDGQTERLKGSHILVAAGRLPNVGGLNLEAAGIKYTQRGISVNAGMLTSNKRVFAIGDVAGGMQFTHVANYQAGIVIRRALFRLPAKASTHAIPWVTYTEPELAHVGLNEEQAREKYSRIRIMRWPFAENDRAQAERTIEGLIKVITDSKGHILGASIVGEHAGEIIQMWALAISAKLKINAMTAYISPYPTLSEINKRAAYGFYTGKLKSPLLRSALKVLRKFG